MDIYTDGSCINSKGGGPGGWAALLIYDDKEVYISGGEKQTTNNRMELTAVIQALLECELTECTIYSDSLLIINCAQRKWKRHKNLDLWGEFDNISSSKVINWKWVKAHSGNKYNEIVDKIARSEIVP